MLPEALHEGAQGDARHHAGKQAELIQALQKKKEGGFFGKSYSQQLQDVNALAVSLQASAKASKEELQGLIADVNGRMLESVKQLSVELAQLRAAVDADRQHTTDLINKTAEETIAHSHMELERQSNHWDLALSQQVGQLRDDLKADLTKQGSWLSELDSKLTLTRAELSSSMAVLRIERKVLQAANDAAFQGAMKETEKVVLKQCTVSLEQTVEQMMANEIEEKRQLARRADQSESTGRLLTNGLESLTHEVENNRQNIENMLSTTKQKFNAELEALVSENRSRLGLLDNRAAHLEHAVAGIENIPTRRIDWVIKDAAAQLAGMASQKHRSTSPHWLSPVFEAAGAHNFQFELRFLSPAEIQANHEQDSLDNQGDCVLTLKADPGLFLVCRLYVGTAFGQLEHTFEEQQKPCSTKALCYIRDQINPKDGTVCVSLEILEAIRTVPREDGPASASLETGALQPIGSMVAHRHLNHRTLDIMQDQVDLIRSGMVRRIEWRIERASQMRKCFPENECICSTTFEAAGVQDLQLVFYPSGFTGAREDFCSFFLHCPAGSQLKCWLSVGKHRREARVSFDKTGYFGRTNFCRFDGCIDANDDTVLLVLEIEEAQQNIEEPLSHPAKVSMVTTKKAEKTLHDDSSRPEVTHPPHDSSPAPEKIDSSLRLQRVTGNKTLQETRQLPSIWTSVPKSDVAEAMDGFHSFKDIKTPRRPNTTGMTRRPLKTSAVPWKEQQPAPLSARQTPDDKRYVMYSS